MADQTDDHRGRTRSMEERTAALARTLACADADARFRRVLLQRKCEELERVLRVLEGKAARRRGAAEEERPSHDQQVVEVGQSIQDAIDRARRVRNEMKGRTEAESDSEEDNEGDEDERRAADGTLQAILSMARTIRETQLTSAQVERTASRVVTVDPPPPQATRVHLEYPRKLKFMVEQLQNKRDEPFRFAFCCKVNEHLSMSAARRQALEEAKGAKQTRLDAPVARIQVPFPKQSERLTRAYARLAAFINDKLAVDSIEFQRAMQSPTLPRLFPFCARLKLAKQMQRVLDRENEELARRAPPRPSLSAAAVAHRDAMLARIRRKRSIDTATDKTTVSNTPLSESEVFVSGPEHDRDLLDALQDAWAANNGGSSSPPVVYPAKLREMVLNEASNVILAAFKQLFASSDLPPRDGDVATMMQLVRLVDSIALARGRRYRSIVAPSLSHS